MATDKQEVERLFRELLEFEVPEAWESARITEALGLLRRLKEFAGGLENLKEAVGVS